MASESKSFVCQPPVSPAAIQPSLTNVVLLLQVALAFGLILVAVWTLQGSFNRAVVLLATCLILASTVAGQWGWRELGLARPLRGAAVVLGSGILLVAVISAAGAVVRVLGPPQALPWNKAWQYAIWALAQEFILQSFIYVRLESVFGARRAVLYASLLFAVAHIPSPLLTILSLLGALFFCEMFRRYRNLYPIGLVHGALGLSIAASLPDSLLHHMRVGIGYLMYHH